MSRGVRWCASGLALWLALSIWTNKAEAKVQAFNWQTLLPYFSTPAHKKLRRHLRTGRCVAAVKAMKTMQLSKSLRRAGLIMAGRCAMRKRQWARAKEWFGAAKPKTHVLRGYVSFWIAEAWARSGDKDGAIKAFLAVPFRSFRGEDARLRAARLLLGQKKSLRAYKALKPTQSRRPDVWWLGIQIARKLKAKWAPAAQRKLARRLWSRAPASAEAKRVNQWRRRGRLRFKVTIQDKLKRASQFNRMYDYRKALKTLRRARAPKKASKNLRCRLYYARGYAWFRRRSYGRGIADLRRAKKACVGHPRYDVRTLYRLGQAYRRRGRDREAATVLRELAKRFPGSFLADDALFMIADRHDRRKRKAVARKVYQEMMRRFPKGDMVSVAYWRLAYQSYRRNKLPEAIKRFKRLLRHNGRSKFAPRARYYLARAWQKRRYKAPRKQRKAMRAKVTKLYMKLVKKHPLHYYSFLALMQLQRTSRKRWKIRRAPLAQFLTAKGRAALAKQAVTPSKSRWWRWVPWGLLPDRAPTDRELLQMFHGTKAAFFHKAAYRRGLALFRMGFKTAAGAEWLRLRRCSVLKRPGKAKRRRGCGRRGDFGAELLSLHFHMAKEYYQSNWAYRSRGIAAGRMPFSIRRVRNWFLAYPKPFQEFVKPAVAVDKVDEGMVYGIMREESAFRTSTRSFANAYGLMQFIISTARSTARTLWPHRVIRPEDLFDPKTCIRLGVRHLLQLYRIFRGQYPLMAGAYNAGPGWVRRWLRNHSYMRFDAWNEAVTIKETRHYIRRVMQSFSIYRFLYHPKRARWTPAPFVPYLRPAVLAKKKLRRKKK